MTRTSQHKVWLAAAATAFVALIAWWGTNASIGYQSELSCCTFDPGTGGGLGLVLWARELGFKIRNLEDPLWEAVTNLDPREGNCFLTAGNGSWSPWEDQLTREQWASIQHWIRRGNALIILTADPATLPKVVRGDLFQSTTDLPKAKRKRPTTDSQDEDESDRSQSVAPADPKTSTVALPDHQSLTVRADGPRWPRKPTDGESAADEHGTVWLRKIVGKGAIYVLLDDFAWTNSGFDGVGNADALAAVLARELRGGVFGFDEYRHGHGRIESFAGYLTKLPGANAFLLIALLLSGVYLLGRNVRFGPPEPFVSIERRTAREYVEAAAFLNQRARAAPLAVESVVRRLRTIGLRRGHSNAEMDELLRQADRFAASDARPARPSEVCTLVRKMIALRKKLYGT
jgi:hypothetical protein